MYDELVKKLRYCGNAISCIHCPYWEGCGGSKENLSQAADAIEDLSDGYDRLSKHMDDLATLLPQSMNDNRKYVAVSIKHTEYKWKFGMPCFLWGFRQTEDNEPRCFSGYTKYPEKAERYALGDFKAHGYDDYIKDDEPVKMTADLCKKWKKYDTVLVDAEQYESYCKFVDLPLQPPKEES